MIAVLLVQLACTAALWQLGGPWAAVAWGAYVCGPAVAVRLLR